LSSAAGYRHYFQIDFRAKSSIQFYLLLTEEAAFIQRGVVQIAQINRLFDLVDIVAGEEDEGHLSLHQLHLFGAMRIGFRFEQCFD